MLIIHVQHFLTNEGKKFFSQFVDEMRKAMTSYNNGFISLRQLIKEDAQDECHFLLEYDNFHLLQEFSKTEAHTLLIEKLKTFQIQKQKIEKFQSKN